MGGDLHSSQGPDVVVAYQSPESLLPANAGAFALLPRRDLATGPRYVRGPRSIEVHKLW